MFTHGSSRTDRGRSLLPAPPVAASARRLPTTSLQPPLATSPRFTSVVVTDAQALIGSILRQFMVPGSPHQPLLTPDMRTLLLRPTSTLTPLTLTRALREGLEGLLPRDLEAASDFEAFLTKRCGDVFKQPPSPMPSTQKQRAPPSTSTLLARGGADIMSSPTPFTHSSSYSSQAALAQCMNDAVAAAEAAANALGGSGGGGGGGSGGGGSGGGGSGINTLVSTGTALGALDVLASADTFLVRKCCGISQGALLQLQAQRLPEAVEVVSAAATAASSLREGRRQVRWEARDLKHSINAGVALSSPTGGSCSSRSGGSGGRSSSPVGRVAEGGGFSPTQPRNAHSTHNASSSSSSNVLNPTIAAVLLKFSNHARVTVTAAANDAADAAEEAATHALHASKSRSQDMKRAVEEAAAMHKAAATAYAATAAATARMAASDMGFVRKRERASFTDTALNEHVLSITVRMPSSHTAQASGSALLPHERHLYDAATSRSASNTRLNSLAPPTPDNTSRRSSRRVSHVGGGSGGGAEGTTVVTATTEAGCVEAVCGGVSLDGGGWGPTAEEGGGEGGGAPHQGFAAVSAIYRPALPLRRASNAAAAAAAAAEAAAMAAAAKESIAADTVAKAEAEEARRAVIVPKRSGQGFFGAVIAASAAAADVLAAAAPLPLMLQPADGAFVTAPPRDLPSPILPLLRRHFEQQQKQQDELLERQPPQPTPSDALETLTRGLDCSSGSQEGSPYVIAAAEGHVFTLSTMSVRSLRRLGGGGGGGVSPTCTGAATSSIQQRLLAICHRRNSPAPLPRAVVVEVAPASTTRHSQHNRPFPAQEDSTGMHGGVGGSTSGQPRRSYAWRGEVTIKVAAPRGVPLALSAPFTRALLGGGGDEGSSSSSGSGGGNEEAPPFSLLPERPRQLTATRALNAVALVQFALLLRARGEEICAALVSGSGIEELVLPPAEAAALGRPEAAGKGGAAAAAALKRAREVKRSELSPADVTEALVMGQERGLLRFVSLRGTAALAVTATATAAAAAVAAASRRTADAAALARAASKEEEEDMRSPITMRNLRELEKTLRHRRSRAYATAAASLQRIVAVDAAAVRSEARLWARAHLSPRQSRD